MRVRLTKQTGRGTVVQPLVEDRTSTIIEGTLLRYKRSAAHYDTATDMRDACLRRGSRLVLLQDSGATLRTSAIVAVDWGPPVVVDTENSRYVLEVCRSTETPTDPRGRRR